MKKVSWSELSTFLQDPKLWHKRYVQGVKDPPTKAMLRGKDIHEMCFGILPTALDPLRYFPKEVRMHKNILTEYRKIVPSGYSHERKCETDIEGVPTLGYWDGHMENKILELKTGTKLWDQERAKNHGQLHMYAAQHLSEKGVLPSMLLVTASTESGKVVAHQIGEKDLEEGAVKLTNVLKEAWKEMRKYDRLHA